jgi:hypothetical protein
MEQRRLRLGDILDDYCPRERRVTNHAVVAMVEDTVKQTRCTTCDAEHPFKGGQAPRRRKKEGTAVLFKEVLAGKPDTDAPPTVDDAPMALHADADDVIDSAESSEDVMATVVAMPAPTLSRPVAAARHEPADLPALQIVAEPEETDAPEMTEGNVEEGPVHRQLIRATLPRIEGQKEERRPTDFTIRQPGGRGNGNGNQFRGGNDRTRPGNAGPRGNGHRPQGASRFGARPGQGQGQGRGQQGQGQHRGQGGGFRPAQQQPRHGGGRKRSR